MKSHCQPTANECIESRLINRRNDTKTDGVNIGFKKIFPIVKMMLILTIIVFNIGLNGQNNFSMKLFGLSIHPKGEKENAFLMPNKLDKNGYLVVNIGGVLSYEHFISNDNLSLKIVQGLYSDCATRFGGFSHIGLRKTILKRGKHTVNGGIGPTIIYRKNWLDLDGYVNQNRFVGGEDEKWQHLFLWYGGEFEYKYYINDKIEISSSLVPGYPDLISLSFGINLK